MRILFAILFLFVAADVRAQHAPAGGVDLYYHTYGDPDGQPVLILNGGPGVSSEHFGGLAEQIGGLNGGYRTILFDQRGTGRSTLDRIDSSTVSIATMVADVEALREYLGIDEWMVMGHSWGGMYAMLYAAAHPERVSALILSASGGVDLEWLGYAGDNIRMRLGPERRAVYDRSFDPEYARANPERAAQERLEAMAAAYVFDPANIPFVVEALSRPGANSPAVRGLVYADLNRIGYDLSDEMAQFDRPAIILAGRQDILGDEVPLRTHSVLPRSELVWLDRCSHYPWLDRPDAYFDAIAGFLEREG